MLGARYWAGAPDLGMMYTRHSNLASSMYVARPAPATGRAGQSTYMYTTCYGWGAGWRASVNAEEGDMTKAAAAYSPQPKLNHILILLPCPAICIARLYEKLKHNQLKATVNQ